MMMKADITIQEKPFIVMAAIIIGLIALGAVYININPTLSNTPKARASITAHTLALYISSLSSVDAGTMEKNLNETYIVQIGRYSDSPAVRAGKDMDNYYLKVLLYDSGNRMVAESEAVPFIASMDISCEKSGICITTDKITYMRITKNSGEDVKLNTLKSSTGTALGPCRMPTSDEIAAYVNTYATRYKVDKTFVLAVMGAESRMQHCDRYGLVTTSKDAYGNPIAFGIMQVTPGTAKLMEKYYKTMFQEEITFNVEDPELNINAGVLLLSNLLKPYQGYDNQKELTIANYNCGGISDAVAKYCGVDKNGCWKKIKPYLGENKEFCYRSNETIPYVERVMRLYDCFDACIKTGSPCYSMDKCNDAWDAKVAE